MTHLYHVTGERPRLEPPHDHERADDSVSVLVHAAFCTRLAERAEPGTTVRSVWFRPSMPAVPGDRLHHLVGGEQVGRAALIVVGPRGHYGTGDAVLRPSSESVF